MSARLIAACGQECRRASPAAGGLGRAVTGRDPQKNAAIAAKLGDDAVFGLDVRDGDSVAATITAVAERFGGLDILVNNAGQFRGGPLLAMKREDWQPVIDTHLTGSFLCAQAAAAAMTACGAGGKIINIGSMNSVLRHAGKQRITGQRRPACSG